MFYIYVLRYAQDDTNEGSDLDAVDDLKTTTAIKLADITRM